MLSLQPIVSQGLSVVSARSTQPDGERKRKDIRDDPSTPLVLEDDEHACVVVLGRFERTAKLLLGLFAELERGLELFWVGRNPRTDLHKAVFELVRELFRARMMGIEEPSSSSYGNVGTSMDPVDGHQLHLFDINFEEPILGVVPHIVQSAKSPLLLKTSQRRSRRT
jgi:hypothetical protein